MPVCPLLRLVAWFCGSVVWSVGWLFARAAASAFVRSFLFAVFVPRYFGFNWDQVATGCLTDGSCICLRVRPLVAPLPVPLPSARSSKGPADALPTAATSVFVYGPLLTYDGLVWRPSY